MLSVNLLLTNATLYKIAGYRIESFMYSINGVSVEKTGDISTYERQFYMEKGTELFKKNIVVGYGGNNFKTHMREIGYSHIAYSHNNYVELLCTLGITGFILYYFSWFKTVFNLIKNRKKFLQETNGLVYLFICIFLSKLFMDVAMISYINEFINILFIIGYCYVFDLNYIGGKDNEKGSILY